MEEEKVYTTVKIVRKLIERRVEKLHELLDERKLALNEELDALEQRFTDENKKDEEELEKWTAYRDQTVDLFKEYEGVDNVQLSRIEHQIKGINSRIETRRVHLEWEDDRAKKEINLIGRLESSESMGQTDSNYEVFQAMNLEVNDKVLYEVMDEGTPDPSEASVIESTFVPIKNKPGEYLKPLRPAPRAPSRTPPIPPLPSIPPIPPPPPQDRKLKRMSSHGYILDNIKYPLERAQSMDDSSFSNPQESELYCALPPSQKQGWRNILRKKSRSIGDKLDMPGVPAPPTRDYTVTCKCMLGTGPGQILKPKNIAISTKTGCIFVAEKGNNRVQAFAPTGDPMFSFGKRLKGNSMMKPYGVCVLNEKVYVSQTQSNCIMVFNTNGEYCMQSGGEGRGEGCFNFPAGLSTDGTRILVCDCANNRIQVLTHHLMFLQFYGIGKLTYPTDITVDSNSNLVVLDRSPTCVHIFNGKGVYQRKLINVSKCPTLSNPLFIAISPRGNIVLSDLLTCSVNIFTMDGKLLWSLGGLHDKETFGEPRGVATDPLGRLVVVCNKEIGPLMIIQFSSDH